MTKAEWFSIPGEQIEKFFSHRSRFISGAQALADLGLIELKKERTARVKFKMLGDW